MPSETTQTAHAIEDYLELFETLAGLGIEYVVIGGCAVGAYARLLGETVFSNDLDVLVTTRTLELVLADSAAIGVRVQKLPAPRSVPVAVLDWKGHEVNVLTSTEGLAPADVEARTAREFHLRDGAGAPILIADPFDLLRNKLAVNRPKDQPHIAILRRFLEEEAVHAFRVEREPRARIGPADRLLEVLGTATLEEALASRLVPLAATTADFRFLAHRAPNRAVIDALLAQAGPGEVASAVVRIARARGLVG